MRTFNLLTVIAFLSISTAAMAASNCKEESNYPLVERSELASLVDQKAAFVVDVNSKESFDEHHVPTAIHYGSHSKDFAKLLPQDKGALIVAYCGGPQCTAWKKAAEEAC